MGKTANPNQFVYRSWGIAGERGDDQFFPNFRLVNGWKMVRAYLTGRNANTPVKHTGNKADATIVESHPGSDWPYVKVHFYGEGYSTLEYQLTIVIAGPRGSEAFSGSGWPNY